MSKYIFIAISILPIVTQALTPKGVGEYEVVDEKDLVLSDEQWHVVPACSYWLVQDIANLGEEKWLEIDGIMELTEKERVPTQSQGYMRGKFTFSTANSGLKIKVVLHPGTKVHIRSLSGSKSQAVYEFSTIRQKQECKNRA